MLLLIFVITSSCLKSPPHPETHSSGCGGQGKFEDANRIYARAIAIGDSTSEPPGPEMVDWLNNRALLLVREVNIQRSHNNHALHHFPRLSDSRVVIALCSNSEL